MTGGTWHARRGNTPLTDVPADYAPDGAGAWFELPEGRDAGKRLFVRDSTHADGRTEPTGGDRPGAHEPDRGVDPATTAVFVHGNPECSYVYRNVVDHLERLAAEPFRAVAVDHVGFGRSDRATYETVAMDHARNLEQLIAAMDLRDVTLVVHDWGGPAGIGAFLREPDRVSNLVVTNSTVFPVPADGRTFGNYPMRGLTWPRLPSVVPDALWGQLAAYAVFRTPAAPPRLLGELALYVAARRAGWVPDSEPLAHRVYSQQFRDRGNVRASKRLVRQTAHWAEGNTFTDPDLGPRDTGPFYRHIQERITPAWGPDGQHIGVRAVVGRWDPTAKPSAMARWRTALPQLSGHVRAFETVGHFVEEERPGAVAAAIADVAGLSPA